MVIIIRYSSSKVIAITLHNDRHVGAIEYRGWLLFDVLFHLACWNPVAQSRPGFKEIIESLEEIALSPFVRTPHESFQSMQKDWHSEIEEMFRQLREKENVSRHLWFESKVDPFDVSFGAGAC